MTLIQLEFDPDVFATLRRSPEEIAAEAKLAAAIVWYAQGRLSQGQAAKLAGLSYAGFLDALSESGVSTSREKRKEIDRIQGSPLPLVECSSQASMGDEITPERAASVLLDEETERHRGPFR